MKEKELEQLKQDARRYRFMKTSDYGELGFSRQCALLALESDKWDAIIDDQIKQMECKGRFAIGEKVLYSSCHPDQPDWIKACFYQEVEVLKYWYPQLSPEPVYQLRFLNNSQKILSMESRITRLNSVNHLAVCPWGDIEAQTIDGLMIRLSRVTSAQALHDEIIEILKREADDQKRLRKVLHVLLRSTSPFVNIRICYHDKPTYMLNGRRSTREDVLRALEELERKGSS